MRRGLEILGWLTAILIFVYASHAALAQTRDPHASVTARPAHSAEQRVADEVKQRELRQGGR